MGCTSSRDAQEQQPAPAVEPAIPLAEPTPNVQPQPFSVYTPPPKSYDYAATIAEVQRASYDLKDTVDLLRGADRPAMQGPRGATRDNRTESGLNATGPAFS